MMREFLSITAVGLAATFWIVLLKMITTKYYVPGLSEIYSMV